MCNQSSDARHARSERKRLVMGATKKEGHRYTEERFHKEEAEIPTLHPQPNGISYENR